MAIRISRLVVPAAFAAAGFAGAWFVLPAPLGVAADTPRLIRTGRINLKDASVHTGDWGELRAFFNGESHGTKDVLTAVTILKPGKAVHPAHRHAEEEYMYIVKGRGQWHLDGKDLAAEEGDMIYAAPWVMHGLINTGDAPLTFLVFKWGNKGVEAPPKPAGDDGK